MFLFKCYWCDTNKRIRVDLHYGLVKINKNDKLQNINVVFVFFQIIPTNILHIHYFVSYLLSKQNLGVGSK
jgi:TRAP-type mannitol/chloroaromatic compound transport system permease small subunit